MFYKNKKTGRFITVTCCLLLVIMSVLAPMTSVSAEKNKSQKKRSLLKLTLDSCEEIEETDYTESTYKAFQIVFENAKKVYDDSGKADGDYEKERESLEKVKAGLVYKNSKDLGRPRPFTELSSDQMVKEMGAGWNLGNTMEAHTGLVPNETLWQSVRTTKAFIKDLHDHGYNTVRIPITWGKMIDENYGINEKWISRVQDIIDYCISQDMYCIINLHHDSGVKTGWINVWEDNIDEVYTKFKDVWQTIALRFRDYDEHLLFESMNAINGNNYVLEKQAHENEVVMNLNQIFTNVVRATGSNNEKRWLIVPGSTANINAMTNPNSGFLLPTDQVEDRMFVSVHYYEDEFSLAKTLNDTVYSQKDMEDLGKIMQRLQDTYVKKGIPVILSEYGAVNKGNSIERAYFCEGITRMCQVTGGIVACYWDQGWYDRAKTPADFSTTLFDRSTGVDIDPVVTDGILKGTFFKGKALKCTDVVKDIKKASSTAPISEITFNKELLEMTVGDSEKIQTSVQPKDNDDIILWKTDDESVATVYNGKIRAKGVGETFVTATAKDGKVSHKVTVRVSTATVMNPITAIETVKDNYEIEKDEYFYLEEMVLPINENASVSYRSSDENVATVSSIGKVVGIDEGTAMITISASSGFTKAVKVSCKKKEKNNSLRVTLNTYYNDDKHKYFGEEIGQGVSISKEGQYTLSFDCNKNLSNAAKKAGVKSLTNLTAIYLKDDDVTKNKNSVSNVKSCNIIYNKIKVDGKELPIEKKVRKSALKNSGIFDTNDPINAWDGSVVNGVVVDKNHVLNFKDMKEPKKIEVTFTLSNLSFKEDEVKEKETKVESIEPEETAEVSLSEAGDTKEISVILCPKGGSDKVSFISSDESIVSIGANRTAIVQEGRAVVTIRGEKEGKTTITAYTKEGLRTIFKVDVGAEKKPQAVETIKKTKNTGNKKMIYTIIIIAAVILAGVKILVMCKKKTKK